MAGSHAMFTRSSVKFIEVPAGCLVPIMAPTFWVRIASPSLSSLSFLHSFLLPLLFPFYPSFLPFPSLNERLSPPPAYPVRLGIASSYANVLVARRTSGEKSRGEWPRPGWANGCSCRDDAVAMCWWRATGRRAVMVMRNAGICRLAMMTGAWRWQSHASVTSYCSPLNVCVATYWWPASIPE